ncbi:efflux RND transporter periplasmic adaptor subunit [Schleiferia thermophila]|jgi:membrane fusion protein (multidrug efflux system)|uniref:efflux RND transporter periplasmic adaptor subunit n=1 Tax=Schleiferia thermophila TaxID=884107 RepID=UPI0009FF71BD|nr:efflux RND transporter periplasmic adaptor subunit [Schleiferia thermophila]
MQKNKSAYIGIRLLNLMSMLALLMNFGCQTRKESQKSDNSPLLAVDYFMAKIEKSAEEYTINAEILPYEAVTITSEVAGIVTSIHFQEGKTVKKGDLLIQLDARESQSRLQAIDAQLEQAERAFRRAESLIATGGISTEEYETTKSRYQQLKADRIAAALLIEKHSVRAPFTGITGMRDLSPGAFVTNQQPLLQLWQINPLKIDIDLPERLSGMVKEGDKISLFSEVGPDSTLAVVYAIEPVVNRATRSSKIRARIDNPPAFLRPGAFVKARVKASGYRDVVKVPADCVVPQLGRLVIYTIDRGIVKPNVVDLGKRDAVYVEVLRGINEGDTVIASGILQLRPGMPVKTAKQIALYEPS